MKLTFPTVKELDVLKKDLIYFRDSGCRILVPIGNYENLLVNKFSGHYFIAPTRRTSLGFSFKEEDRISKNFPLPQILKYSSVNPFLGIHIGEKDYFIIFNHEQLNTERTLIKGQEMYKISLEWMLKTKAIEFER